jgi:hypothetical protein
MKGKAGGIEDEDLRKSTALPPTVHLPAAPYRRSPLHLVQKILLRRCGKLRFSTAFGASGPHCAGPADKADGRLAGREAWMGAGNQDAQ